MKRLIFLMAVFLLVTAAVLPCRAAPLNYSYFVFNQWGGSWQDANKTAANTEDDLLCWAAAASNVLSWGRWGTPAYNTTDKIFTYFQNHWTDQGGLSSWAYNYWITGYGPTYLLASVPDVPYGGGFYPDLRFSDYYVSGFPQNLVGSSDFLLHLGYGVVLNIDNGGRYLHALTCWGFEYEYANNKVSYKSIYVTDSDDGLIGLAKYPLLQQDKKWYLGGEYEGWQLNSLMALEIRDLPPGYASFVQSMYGATQNLNISALASAYPTPVAPSWVLLGTGLVGLMGRRLWRGRRKTPAVSTD